MKLYGLAGYPLEHSKSPELFSGIFARNNCLDCRYVLFPAMSAVEIPEIINQNKELCGLNITIPLKTNVTDILDELDEVAAEVGAVNTISIQRHNTEFKLKGYNTDVDGFEATVLSTLTQQPSRALILGTGGASKAVQYVFRKLNIPFSLVSRYDAATSGVCYTYANLTGEVIASHAVIVNTTPLGMFPDTGSCPDIPYQHIVEKQLCIDLIYNPEETLFLKKVKSRGAVACNGMQMLVKQAEKAFEIWNC